MLLDMFVILNINNMLLDMLGIPVISWLHINTHRPAHSSLLSDRV
jgi:hypothetical protein